VAALFLAPALVLTLLVNAAFSLERGLGAPGVWAGALVVPWVATAGGLRRACVRGLWFVTALCALFAAVVHLRLWTGAGGPVLEREGLVVLSRWALGAGTVGALAAVGLARRAPAPEGPRT
jgi:hypothetical protein